jgi:hypothetical protein
LDSKNKNSLWDWVYKMTNGKLAKESDYSELDIIDNKSAMTLFKTDFEGILSGKLDDSVKRIKRSVGEIVLIENYIGVRKELKKTFEGYLQ